MAANSRFAMATHIMAGLALAGDELTSSTYLAESVNTNPVVVRRILSDLQKAGLVETQAGKTGGARLARSAGSVSLQAIYEAVDGGMLFAFNPNDPNRRCELSCVMKSVLEPIFASANQALEKELKSFKLSDLVARVEKTRKRTT